MTVQKKLQAEIYYGNYDPIKRWEKNVATLREKLGHKTLRKADEVKAESVPTGVMAQIQPILKEIEALAKEVDSYNEHHIKQDFRRINATLLEMQVKLDRIDVTKDADARAAVKRGIIESEEAADRLMDKITHEYKKCSECLRL